LPKELKTLGTFLYVISFLIKRKIYTKEGKYVIIKCRLEAAFIIVKNSVRRI